MNNTLVFTYFFFVLFLVCHSELLRLFSVACIQQADGKVFCALNKVGGATVTFFHRLSQPTRSNATLQRKGLNKSTLHFAVST